MTLVKVNCRIIFRVDDDGVRADIATRDTLERVK